MREIKFRAWIGALNCWADEIIISQVGDVWGYIAIKNDNKYFNAELEQFTGLCDKNGKEIYEGDILLIHHVRLVIDGPIHKPRMASVEWVEDETGFRLVGSDVKSTNPWLYPHSHLEVIGNIHENPELLK